MCPKGLPGRLLELLGLLNASWSCLAGLLGRSGKPLGRSWVGLGGLLGALGRVLDALGAVWEASCGPKGFQDGAQEGSKSGPRGDSSRKRRNHKTLRTSHEIPLFFRSQVLTLGTKMESKTVSKTGARC